MQPRGRHAPSRAEGRSGAGGGGNDYDYDNDTDIDPDSGDERPCEFPFPRRARPCGAGYGAESVTWNVVAPASDTKVPVAEPALVKPSVSASVAPAVATSTPVDEL